MWLAPLFRGAVQSLTMVGFLVVARRGTQHAHRLDHRQLAIADAGKDRDGNARSLCHGKRPRSRRLVPPAGEGETRSLFDASLHRRHNAGTQRRSDWVAWNVKGSSHASVRMAYRTYKAVGGKATSPSQCGMSDLRSHGSPALQQGRATTHVCARARVLARSVRRLALSCALPGEGKVHRVRYAREIRPPFE